MPSIAMLSALPLLAALAFGLGWWLGGRRMARTLPTPAPTVPSAQAMTSDSSDAQLELVSRVGQIGLWQWTSPEEPQYWNAQLCRLLGLEPEQHSAGLATWHQVLHPDDRERVEHAFREAMQQRQDFSLECRVLWPDGAIRYLRCAGAPQHQAGLQGACWDVTSQRHQEAALRQTSLELQNLIDQMPIGISEWDSSLHNRFANVTCAAKYGLSPAQVRGKHLAELIGAAAYAVAKPHIDRVLADNQPTSFEYETTNANGIKQALLVSCTPDSLAGTVRGFHLALTDLSGLRQAEQARRTAELHLRNVVDAASEFALIATDRDGLITLFSRGAERLLGYRAEDMVGKRTPGVFHDAAEIAARQAELSAQLGRPIGLFETFVARSMDGFAETRDWTYIRKDGSRVPVNLCVTAIYDGSAQHTGFLGVARDITPQRQAAETLQQLNASLSAQVNAAQQARADFETLFAQAPGALLVVSHDGRIAKANAMAHRMFDYAPGELVGASVDSLVPPEFRNQHPERRATYYTVHGAATTTRLDRPLPACRKDGSCFDAEISLSPLNFEGDNCTIVVVHDVTAQRELQNIMRSAIHNAEATNRAKDEFLTNMGHEIRTPMHAILGMAQLLERSPLSHDQHTQVQMIRNAGQTLLGTLNDILYLAQLEAGRVAPTPQALRLDHLVQNLGATMETLASNRPLHITITRSPALPPALQADEQLLLRTVSNLLDNAFKFTEQGEIHLILDAATRQDGQTMLRISVRDDGIGMSEEQQANLFVPFSPGDTSATRRHGGTGLGLAIAYRLAKLMQGHIHVESQVGRGSLFRLELPLEVVDSPGSETAPPVAPAGRDAMGERLGHDTSRRAMTLALRELVRDGMQPLQRAEAALVREAWPEMAEIMHSLRGSVGHFDVSHFSASASAVEAAIKAQRYATVADLLPECLHRYQTLLDAARSWLVEQTNLGTSHHPAAPPLTPAALDSLIQLLDDQAFNAIEAFERLYPALYQQDAVQTTDIERLLDKLDFRGAAEKLRTLADALGHQVTH